VGSRICQYLMQCKYMSRIGHQLFTNRLSSLWINHDTFSYSINLDSREIIICIVCPVFQGLNLHRELHTTFHICTDFIL
jgi:hypothetical protein